MDQYFFFGSISTAETQSKALSLRCVKGGIPQNTSCNSGFKASSGPEEKTGWARKILLEGRQVLVSLGDPVVLLEGAEGDRRLGRVCSHGMGTDQVGWSRGAWLSLQQREVSSEGQTWKCVKPKASPSFLLNDPLQAILELLSNSFVQGSWCDFCTTLGSLQECSALQHGDIFTSVSVGQKKEVILGTE